MVLHSASSVRNNSGKSKDEDVRVKRVIRKIILDIAIYFLFTTVSVHLGL